jgi:2-oxoglutarate dehydrogenase E2 component (dihydrolipoamide succinyltransferase)
MARFEILMPKMGESIIEATITKWLKNEGDKIGEDEAIVEIATDKVDSEIPAPLEGILVKKLYNEGDVVPVGQVIAYLSIDGEENDFKSTETEPSKEISIHASTENQTVQSQENTSEESSLTRFYSPLVKNIAKQENIPLSELEKVPGSGKDGRLTKEDLMVFLQNKSPLIQTTTKQEANHISQPTVNQQKETTKIESPVISALAGDQIIEMDRMRKLIADHMVMSKRISPHVTSFIEVDMTPIVLWRNKNKDLFEKREGEKLTFMSSIIQATVKALKDFPGVNASVNDYKIILRKSINIGIATALPNGNLIVPVIKQADEKNLMGLQKSVNDLANRARINKLQPDEIQEGTFTITNLGTFGSLTGTPVINQPQVAILAVGTIEKKPVVLETPEGDVIAIRHRMIMSLSYDHRVVDGGMGGQFLKRAADYLETFDINQII